MSAPKFTPGPWAVQASDERCVVAPNEPYEAIVAIVAESDSSLGRTPERVVHNARLIAAAPDLLNALQLLVADCEAIDAEPFHAEEARAALAKAEGR